MLMALKSRVRHALSCLRGEQLGGYTSSNRIQAAPRIEPMQPPGIWSENRKTTHKWLHSKQPCLAELYESFLWLTESNGFPGRARLVAHCIREIRNTLMRQYGTTTRIDYVAHVDSIAERWSTSQIALDENSQVLSDNNVPPSTDVQIDRETALTIDSLVQKHRSTRHSNLVLLERFFETLQPAEAEDESQLRVLARQWKTLTDVFLHKSHTQKTDEEELTDDFVNDTISFERYLLSFATSHETISRLEDIDAVLADANRN